MTLIFPRDSSPYSDTVIGTLAVDGCAVTFGTARRGLGGLRLRPGPSSRHFCSQDTFDELSRTFS